MSDSYHDITAARNAGIHVPSTAEARAQEQRRDAKRRAAPDQARDQRVATAHRVLRDADPAHSDALRAAEDRLTRALATPGAALHDMWGAFADCTTIAATLRGKATAALSVLERDAPKVIHGVQFPHPRPDDPWAPRPSTLRDRLGRTIPFPDGRTLHAWLDHHHDNAVATSAEQAATDTHRHCYAPQGDQPVDNQTIIDRAHTVARETRTDDLRDAVTQLEQVASADTLDLPSLWLAFDNVKRRSAEYTARHNAAQALLDSYDPLPETRHLAAPARHRVTDDWAEITWSTYATRTHQQSIARLAQRTTDATFARVNG